MKGLLIAYTMAVSAPSAESIAYVQDEFGATNGEFVECLTPSNGEFTCYVQGTIYDRDRRGRGVCIEMPDQMRGDTQ